MKYERLHLLKIASLSTGQKVLTQTGIELPKAPELPKTPRGESVKLTTEKGKKKPAYVHKKQRTSPYNPN